MFYIAKIRGAIIETYNIGRANSASSMIAVSGTPGHRYMNEYATHTIHYGKSSCEINHPDEAKFAIKDFNNVVNMVYDIYLSNTKLTKKDLSKYLRIEGSGQLSAKECLQKGVCDYVITKHKITHSIADLKRYTSR